VTCSVVSVVKEVCTPTCSAESSSRGGLLVNLQCSGVVEEVLRAER